jgi:hypothetical protein
MMMNVIDMGVTKHPVREPGYMMDINEVLIGTPRLANVSMTSTKQASVVSDDVMMGMIGDDIKNIVDVTAHEKYIEALKHKVQVLDIGRLQGKKLILYMSFTLGHDLSVTDKEYSILYDISTVVSNLRAVGSNMLCSILKNYNRLDTTANFLLVIEVAVGPYQRMVYSTIV